MLWGPLHPQDVPGFGLQLVEAAPWCCSAGSGLGRASAQQCQEVWQPCRALSPPWDTMLSQKP